MYTCSNANPTSVEVARYWAPHSCQCGIPPNVVVVLAQSHLSTHFHASPTSPSAHRIPTPKLLECNTFNRSLLSRTLLLESLSLFLSVLSCFHPGSHELCWLLTQSCAPSLPCFTTLTPIFHIQFQAQSRRFDYKVLYQFSI